MIWCQSHLKGKRTGELPQEQRRHKGLWVPQKENRQESLQTSLWQKERAQEPHGPHSGRARNRADEKVSVSRSRKEKEMQQGYWQEADSMLFGDGLISKNGNLQERERQTSSDILKELMMQGIIQSQTRFVRNGEAYDVMVEPSEKPLRKPPVKLEKLKIKKKKKKTLTREDIENKMRAAEERRKVKEEALKKRLRSERPFPESTLQSIDELKGEELSLAEEGPEATVSTHPVTLESQLGERRIAMRALQILQETHSNSEDLDEIGALESDITYNTQHETGSDLKDDSF
ncbi:stathmin domain-containing protein 1 isoform X2 [Rhinatrema bivittatum]|uniref:stathmin domain-containing protein 1 isoform X2 n=1 Tax=Rhinatrema bivittatum TaxID=194408 RepID=UPI00112855F6|nr:stathmin domain-containing protein 1 isoform X2 [Rhinatrema bivittatum]